MKIVVDDKIPYIQEPLRLLADEVKTMPGRDIGPADVRDADILVVRTRTRCDRALLEGSRVRLVLTATIGYDHIDSHYLEASGIAWHNCPGCNATSVAQYVRNSLLLLQMEKGIDLKASTLGIIGVGHVGTAVAAATRPLMGDILLNDPPRQERGDAPPTASAEHRETPMTQGWASLEEVLTRSDIITLHTPLTTDGRYPTFHLVDKAFIARWKRHGILLNAARGEVVDEQALEDALDEGHIREAVIDTWEHEPDISRRLLEKVYIGTPHIAGYSADGKANASRTVLAHICTFLHRPMTFDIVPPPLPAGFIPAKDAVSRSLQYYDPRQDSARLKAQPETFETLRSNYPLRREEGQLS